MSVKANVLEEIRNRLYTATQGAGVLSGVKIVRVGAIEESRKPNDFPIITIRLLSGSEDMAASNNRFRDSMVVGIQFVHEKLSNNVGSISSNTLYKTSNGTGAVYLLDKILNTVDKATSGTVDSTLSQTARNMRRYSYNIDEENDKVEINIQIEINSIEFSAGAR